MKNLLKNLVVVGIALTTLTGTAATAPENSNSTLITFNNVKPGQTLLIKNQSGTIIHKEVIKDAGSYSKRFELENLPKGSYTIELEKDFEIKIIPFKVENNVVEMLEHKNSVFFKPVVRTKDNYLFVSKLSFEETPMNVKVYYDNASGSRAYDLIYSETLDSKTIMERVYALEKNEKGSYKVVLSSNNRTFTKFFKI